MADDPTSMAGTPADPLAQWNLTVAQARAFKGKGARGGAFLLDRETVLAVAGRLEAGAELAKLVHGVAAHRREMLEGTRRCATAFRGVLEKYAELSQEAEGLGPVLRHLETTIEGLEAILAEDAAPEPSGA